MSLMKFLKLSLLSALLFLFGCEAEEKFFISEVSSFELSDQEHGLIAEGFGGLGFVVKTMAGYEHVDSVRAQFLRGELTAEEVGNFGYYGNLYINDLEEMFIVLIQNIYPTSRRFSLHLWLNFEPISFEVAGENNLGYYFTFEMDAASGLYIPLRLPLNLERNMTHALTASIFAQPHVPVAQDQYLRFSYAMSFHHDLTYGKIGEIHLTEKSTLPLEQLPDYPIHTLYITPVIDISREAFISLTLPHLAPHVVRAEAGSILELSYFVQPFINDEDTFEGYAILALLDFEPIALNGRPYLLTIVNDDVCACPHYGRMSIQVPNEPGLYDFIGMVIPNPHHRRSRLNYYPLEHSVRFTIEVTD